MTQSETRTVTTISLDPAGSAEPVCSIGVRYAPDVPHLGLQFVAAADRFRHHVAIRTASRSYRYDWLLTAAASVCDRLVRDPGFQSGDRVILLQHNSPEYVAGFYGVLLAGGVVVPVPPDIDAARMAWIIDATDASIVLTQPRVATHRADLRTKCHESLQIPDASVGQEWSPQIPPAHTGDDLAAIYFTAGSSGLPKGVMLSHLNLIANAESIQQYLGVHSGDRPLCVLPFYHAFGNSVLQSHILAGAELVLDGSVMFPESIIEAAARHAATSLSAVPDLFRFLLDRSTLGHTRLPSLRYMAVAGGALPHDTSLQIADRIAPAAFYVMYGQTEATARLAYLPPEHLRALPGSIGRAVPGVHLEVVNEHGQAVASGEIGEIRARGGNVMRGYWRDPQATAEVIRHGFLYTGDLATVDEAGWIFVKGRRSSFVKIAGHRVHPGELESFVTSRLAARQAVAVPFESLAGGTRLALYVLDATEASRPSVSEIIAGCRMNLPRHLVPDYVQVVDAFPLNHALKIDRPLLTRRAETATTQRRSSA